MTEPGHDEVLLAPFSQATVHEYWYDTQGRRVHVSWDLGGPEGSYSVIHWYYRPMTFNEWVNSWFDGWWFPIWGALVAAAWTAATLALYAY